MIGLLLLQGKFLDVYFLIFGGLSDIAAVCLNQKYSKSVINVSIPCMGYQFGSESVN